MYPLVFARNGSLQAGNQLIFHSCTFFDIARVVEKLNFTSRMVLCQKMSQKSTILESNPSMAERGGDNSCSLGAKIPEKKDEN